MEEPTTTTFIAKFKYGMLGPRKIEAHTIEEAWKFALGVFRKDIAPMDDWPVEDVVESIEPAK